MISRRQFLKTMTLAAAGSLTGFPVVQAAAPMVGDLSDHFDGKHFFNPGIFAAGKPIRMTATGGRSRWIWRWLLGNDWPEWPEADEITPGPAPAARVLSGEIRIIPVGHATFLIQMDGLNLLIDPIWSERCSPVSWAGPRRCRKPGIRFADLPPIDAVLISHNHYDHLDLATLRRLAYKGTPRAVTSLGNGALIRETGIPRVEDLDWWESLTLAPEVTVTLVPAQHFSSRTLWDRNETLWGGFIVSGPSGHIYHAGDTGYGPHFGEIARRFPGIQAALLPISPYQPLVTPEPTRPGGSIMHMGPAEAVRAHMDLGVPFSMATHFQVFQLGGDGFDDAVRGLSAALQNKDLSPAIFTAPLPGRAVALPPALS